MSPKEAPSPESPCRFQAATTGWISIWGNEPFALVLRCLEPVAARESETAFMVTPIVPKRRSWDPSWPSPRVEAAKALWHGLWEFQLEARPIEPVDADGIIIAGLIGSRMNVATSRAKRVCLIVS